MFKVEAMLTGQELDLLRHEEFLNNPHPGPKPDRFPQSKLPLYDLLIHFKDSQCGDPRDKVFSLLSLIPENEQRALTRVFPDYSLAVEEVIVMTLAFLKSYRCRSITYKDDELFDAFNVVTVIGRKRLLERSRLYEPRFATDDVTWACEASPQYAKSQQYPAARKHARKQKIPTKQEKKIVGLAYDLLSPVLSLLEKVQWRTKSQRTTVAAWGACIVSFGVMWYHTYVQDWS